MDFMDYTISYGSGKTLTKALGELEREVRGLLSQGWKAQGGVSVLRHSHNWFYVCQALVKEE